MRHNIIILGAGLSGLSAAYHLNNKGYVIFEKDSQIGGAAGSYKVGDFIFDKTIHIFYSRDEYANNLVRTILLKDNLIEGVRMSFCCTKGIYTEYPFQFNLYGLPPEIIKECLLGLIKAIYEPAINTPNNFREWILKTFGEGIAKHFMIPYNNKVWTTPLEEMDFNWIAERVPVPDLDQVISGSLAPPKKKIGWNNDFMYPLRNGIISLAKGFLPFVHEPKLSSKITKIDLNKKTVLVNNESEYEFGKLISSLPLILYPDLVESVPQEIIEAIKRLGYNTVYTINLGVNRKKISNYHWVYYADEDVIFHRIYFPSNLSPNMAPEGTSSVSVEVTVPKSKDESVSEEELYARVVKDLKKVGILRENDKIIAKKIIKVHPAYIVYNHTHKEDVKLIHNWLRENDILPIGRFGEWEYLNMDKAILSGKKAADIINSNIAKNTNN